MAKYAGFSSVKMQRPQRSLFDLSHYKRSSTRAGRLTPVLLTECVPSDTFNGSSEILVRVAPLLAPLYDTLILFVHFFFVPNRLVWEDWEEFITGGRLGTGVEPVVAPVPPFFDLGGLLDSSTVFDKSHLGDYLGCPIFTDLPGYVPGAYGGIPIDAMPFLVYQKVWMDYYRDRNFVADDLIEFPIPSGEVADATEFVELRTRAYEHDYFNSTLPFTQRGVEVLMPLAGTGSVTYLEHSNLFEEDGITPAGNGAASVATSVGGDSVFDTPASGPIQIQNIDEVELTASSVSINDFRGAYALQVWLERNAVGGSRYTESTQSHFGVKPQDSRLQRAEYVGGGRISINIKEIVSTSYSDDGSAIVPLANLAGHGLAYGNTNRFHYFCPEHGFIIGIASILNPSSYHQGLPRMFRRRSFLDYPWPTFAKLGEQQVDKAELFASAVNLTEDADGNLPLFGYQSRYADWKYMWSSNHGDFHDTLLFWTLTRVFAASPVLGQAFVEYDDSSQDRIFAASADGSDSFWLFVNNNLSVKRPLPYFSTPNTLGFS